MRRHRAKKRNIAVDPRFGDKVTSKFINTMMRCGKKSVARKSFYGALDDVAALEKRDGKEVFMEAMGNVRATYEVRSRRVGGATYPVPVPVRPERSEALAMRWLINAARKRSEKSMIKRLSGEFRDASQQRGAAFKQRSDIERMAEANRAFSHFRF